MKKNIFLKPVLLILSLFILNFYVIPQDIIRFDSLGFISDLPEKDSTILFIKDCLEGNYNESSKIYPDITNLDVSELLRNDGDKEYLLGPGDYIIPYLSDSNKILAVSIYLRKKYSMREDSFSSLLEGACLISKHKGLSLYLLAELRYKFQYDWDAKYLIYQLHLMLPENKEVSRLYALFEKIGGDVKNVDLDFKEFLKREVIYSTATLRE